MKVLVTGAAGRLGMETACQLVAAKHEVVATDITYRSDLPVKLHHADLLDLVACRGLLEGVDALVHLGNHATCHKKDGTRVYRENTAMNVNVFDAACVAGVKNIIFASSIQVMAAERNGPEFPPSKLAYLPADGDLPCQASNLYSLSKMAGEQLLRSYAEHRGMNCVAIRYPGLSRTERQPRHGSNWERSHNLDECFSYLLYSDAASLILAILRSKLNGFRVYFPAAAKADSHLPIPEIIRKYYSTVPLRKPIDKIASLVDITRITEETGWTPQAVGEP